MKEQAQFLNSFGTTIFSTISKLANEHQAINLGQGAPDFDGPSFLVEAFQKELDKKKNQYSPGIGEACLREEVSKLYNNKYQLNFCPNNEVNITNGATEGIYASLASLINPGDEVVIFEPFYDSYWGTLKMLGANIKLVTLKAPHFSFDNDELEETITKKTKLVIFNNPQNPTGKVFTLKELTFLSQLIIKNDCYALSDEVYEFLTFDQHQHIPLATLPGMWERTITLSSAGKTFGMTGWKIGWAVAPSSLSQGIMLTRQFISFSVNGAAQRAIATGLKQLESYLPQFQKEYSQKRDILCSGLDALNIKYFKPEGTYFVMVSLEGLSNQKDTDFCEELIKKYGVATIPPSGFYKKSNEGERWLRLCFAKKNETLEQAILKLQRLRS
jgi:L-glutamine---4-(methylsulfanyl)-2-oxobutanoate aminotransferase